MFNLNSLYTPKCIIASSKNKGCYEQLKPSNNLTQFIYCYWASPGDMNNLSKVLQAPKKEFIVPDGCVDVVFTINKKKKEYFSTIYGPIDNPYTLNMYYDKIQNFGITFYPGCLYQFLKCSLSEIRNKRYNLEDVMDGTWKQLEYEIINANTVVDMAKISNRFFASLLDKYSVTDPLSNMLFKIYKSNGTVSVKELSQSEIRSERQIGRIFNNWIGVNPKRFLRIVRFQSVIQAAISSPKVDWISIALDHKYYDESHFFNEFKEFCGITPEQYLKSV